MCLGLVGIRFIAFGGALPFIRVNISSFPQAFNLSDNAHVS